MRRLVAALAACLLLVGGLVAPFGSFAAPSSHDVPLLSAQPRKTFDLPLVTSIVPSFAAGSSTPTYTRLLAADQIDFEGLHHQVLSGEARFQGARRVRNLLDATEDFTQINGGDSAANTNTATSVTFTNATAYRYKRVTGADVAGHTYVARAVLSSTDKAVVGFRIATAGADAATKSVTLTSTPTIYSVTMTATSAQAIEVGLDNRVAQGGDGTTTGTVTITKFQLEDVTGQTNQNPSEYVPVGVLSAPYHGAGVDGVKYFDTLNGNTVASNIVTEATGAHIDSSQSAAAGGVAAGVVDASGPLGYLAEGAATNLALQSADFTTTWAISNAADMNAVVADQYVAPDGTTTMDKIQPKNTNATHFITQGGITVAATVYTYSIFARYISQRWIVLILYDGVVARYASFDLQNGVAGAVAGATSKITPTAISGVYRLSITNTANLTAGATGALYVSLNQSDSASTQTWTPAGTELLGLWGAQLELGSIATSYIPTTTVAVTRNADVLTYPSAGNISIAQGTAYAEFTTADSGTTAERAVIGGQNAVLETLTGAGAQLALNDGAANRSFGLTTTRPITTPVKAAVEWGGSTSNGALSGAVGTPATFDGTLDIPGALYIGDVSAGNRPLYGTIRNVRIWGNALSSGRLQALTQ